MNAAAQIPSSSDAVPRTSTTLTAHAASQLLGVSKATVHRLAAEHHWPSLRVGNALVYEVPGDWAAANLPDGAPATARPRVTFASLTHDARARARVLAREQAVLMSQGLLDAGTPKETALQSVCAHVRGTACDEGGNPLFPALNPATLRTWIAAYQAHGLDGLCEQKRGASGRRRAASHLTPEQLRAGRAAAYEHGSIAKGARTLSVRPDLTHGARAHLHEAHASRSHVPRSVREELQTSPLTQDYLQGPRAARLNGRFTPGDYSQVLAGDVFTADDMTSNVYCWCEWPGTAQGWRIAQAQVLPVLDVGSLRWLNVRVVLRASGAYTADDVWGLFGDTFDQIGLPRDGFVLEFGSWQSTKVKGARTGLTNEERAGGLRSLGLRLRPSYDPRSKIVETRFNELQAIMDRAPGFIGREQRYDKQERVAALVRDCEAGRAHPRQYFMHVSQLADHIRAAMEQMNDARSDGKVLAGASPNEKWRNDFSEPGRALAAIPDTARWMYRSAATLVRVTRNGVRVQQGSGQRLLTHYYDNPEILVPRCGQKVWVYWQDGTPQADAVILSGDAKRTFLGVAKYVQPLGRFTATPEQLDAEAQRKRAALHYARTEARAMEPHLVRHTRPMPLDKATAQVGEVIRAATEAADEAVSAAKAERRERGAVRSRAMERTAGVDPLEELSPDTKDEPRRMPDRPPQGVSVEEALADL